MTPRETPGVRSGAGKPVPPAAGSSAGQPSVTIFSGKLPLPSGDSPALPHRDYRNPGLFPV